ncbi:MAG TPA: hypothetical protein DIC23_04775, partial [Planctomycetaceae bacterium]|nr:hypothetical protein [Planctomycetaceae bacterium]
MIPTWNGKSIRLSFDHAVRIHRLADGKSGAGLKRCLSVEARFIQSTDRGDSKLGGGAAVATQFLLIDGYNLLHAAGFARKRYGPGQFEKCRQRLLQGLADRLSGEQRGRATVVFDAQQAPADVPSV